MISAEPLMPIEIGERPRFIALYPPCRQPSVSSQQAMIARQLHGFARISVSNP